MSKRPMCYYHADCFDGIAAAWVCWKFFEGEVDLQPIQYGDPIAIDKSRMTYILDFSLKVDVIRAMDSHNLVILDHHKTAAEDFMFNTTKEDLAAFKGIYVFDMSRSGAMMAWDYFFTAQPAPYSIKWIQDRDLWKFEYPTTKMFTAILGAKPLTVENFELAHRMSISEVNKTGELLLEKQQFDVSRISKEARVITINDYELLLVNANHQFASDLGDYLSNNFNHKYDGVAVYIDIHSGRKFSLRTNRCEVDLGWLATLFGGGGHRKAASFVLPYSDKRFGKSHIKIRSKGYWWNRVKYFLMITCNPLAPRA